MSEDGRAEQCNFDFWPKKHGHFGSIIYRSRQQYPEEEFADPCRFEPEVEERVDAQNQLYTTIIFFYYDPFKQVQSSQEDLPEKVRAYIMRRQGELGNP